MAEGRMRWFFPGPISSHDPKEVKVEHDNETGKKDGQPQRRLRLARRTSRCQVPTLGEVSLQAATMGDLREVASAVDGLPEGEQDEQFANELLVRMVVTPDISVQEVADLPNDVITPLINCAVELLSIKDEYVAIDDTVTPRARLVQAFREHFFRPVRSMLASISKSLAPAATVQFDGLAQAMKSAGFYAADTHKALLAAAGPAVEAQRAVKAFQQTMSEQFGATIRNAQLTAEALGAPMQQILNQTDQFIGLASGIARVQEQVQLVPQLTSNLIGIGLPEPLLSDSLLISGLNSPQSHTPSYQMPVIRPMETPEEVEPRAEDATRQRLKDAYDTLIVLEPMLRRYVGWRLEQHAGPKWWRQRIPEVIRTECKERKAQRETPDSRQHAPIHYMFIGELKTVICKGDNWAQVFGPDFNNERTTIDTMFLWLEPVRKDLAHPRDFSDVEYQQFRIAAEWLLRAIDRALSAR